MSSERQRNWATPDRPTTSTDMVFVGTGIVLGGFVGLLSVTIGGIPLTLTASGGALVMGLVFGWLRSVYPFFGRIPEPAIWIFDTVGLCMFIGVVGLSAGPSFVAGLQKTGISLVFVGLVAALLPHTDWDSLRTFRIEDGTAHRARRLRRSRDDHRRPARHSGRGAQQHSGAWLYRALRHRQHSADGLGAGPHRVDVENTVTCFDFSTHLARPQHRLSRVIPFAGSAHIITSPWPSLPARASASTKSPRQIGEGGMGEVYRATDTTLGRQVAIKILPDAFAADPDRLARFEREAQDARVAESSAHRRDLRVREIRRRARPRDGTGRGRGLCRSASRAARSRSTRRCRSRSRSPRRSKRRTSRGSSTAI